MKRSIYRLLWRLILTLNDSTVNWLVDVSEHTIISRENLAHLLVALIGTFYLQLGILSDSASWERSIGGVAIVDAYNFVRLVDPLSLGGAPTVERYGLWCHELVRSSSSERQLLLQNDSSSLHHLDWLSLEVSMRMSLSLCHSCSCGPRVLQVRWLEWLYN